MSLKKLVDAGVPQITVVNILACPEGIQRITSEYPDVHMVVAKIDEALNDKGYILPGSGTPGIVSTGPMTTSFHSRFSAAPDHKFGR